MTALHNEHSHSWLFSPEAVGLIKAHLFCDPERNYSPCGWARKLLGRVLEDSDTVNKCGTCIYYKNEYL